MRSIVVTGATSMIGSALIEECVSNNISVLAIVRRGSSRLDRLPRSPLVETAECDLDDLASLGSALGEYDVFYHLAWGYTSKETREDPELQYGNIKYTLDAVRLAARLKCQKFIGAGSQAEYGSIDGRIYPDARVEPSSSYGIAKYAAGKLSRILCDSLELVHIWGRVFSVYGKNDNDGTMIKYALEQFYKGEAAHFSAGMQSWNYLYERDAGRIFYLLGEHIQESKVCNVAGPDTRPLREFVQELASVLGDGFKYEFAEPGNIKTFGLDPDCGDLFSEIQMPGWISFVDGCKAIVQLPQQLKD